MGEPVFIFDDFQLKFVVSQLKKTLTDMSPVMDEIGQTLQDEIRLQLGRGQTPWGDKMEPLKSRSGVPLNDTRQHIYNRITHTFDSKSVSVGMNEEVGIGRTHQFGAIIKPRKANAHLPAGEASDGREPTFEPPPEFQFDQTVNW